MKYKKLICIDHFPHLMMLSKIHLNIDGIHGGRESRRRCSLGDEGGAGSESCIAEPDESGAKPAAGKTVVPTPLRVAGCGELIV